MLKSKSNLNFIPDKIKISTPYLSNYDMCCIEDMENCVAFRHISAVLSQISKHLEKKIIIYLDSPVLIAGDIHGNYGDLIAIINKFNYLYKNDNSTKLLFLGDYVDRGDNSLDVITQLFSLKITYPNNVFLLRGNHETEIGKNYVCSLYNELILKFDKIGEDLYLNFLNVFADLPLIAIINNDYFCCHGGIPKPNDEVSFIECMNSLKNSDLPYISDFKQCKINNYVNPELYKHIFNILWNDPFDNQFVVSEQTENYFYPNFARTGSTIDSGLYVFNSKASIKFCNDLNFKAIIRAHEFVQEGINTCHDEHVITVFSSSKYCDYDNIGAILYIPHKNENISFDKLIPASQLLNDNITKISTNIDSKIFVDNETHFIFGYLNL